ncbi:hypothetical protein F183_A01430 [Bryobacterales bacterium F-183]|nr:hypothetical protein F183_A01430 [Bryobacterales bacterium F-183]
MRKLSRRGVFARAVAAAVVPQVVTLSSAQTPASSTKEEDMASARAAIASSSAALAKVKVPIATEPAFAFKAY